MRNQISKISATEAARTFSELLARVTKGEQTFIERRNELVAVIAPPSDAPRRISDCLKVQLPGPSATPDLDFASDLEDIIRNHPTDEPVPWD